MGQLDSEDYQQAIDVLDVQGDRLPSGRDLSAGETAALMETCTRSNRLIDYRDGALLSVLLAGGLRRSEVVGLAIEDYEPSNGCLKITKAKRSKQRTVYLPAGGMAAMADWLKVRGSAPGVGTHSFRRSLAMNLHGKGVPLKAIAGITGHESLGSLARYIEVTPEQKRASVMNWQGARLSLLEFPALCNRDRGGRLSPFLP